MYDSMYSTLYKGELMMNAYKEFWTKMFVWNGTATRSQYWIPVIINYFLGGIVANAVEKILGHPITEIYNFTDLTTNTAAKIIMILLWIATLTVKVRRLHDTNRSAGWILISAIPLIGTIWFFILMILPTTSKSRWTVNQSHFTN